MLCWHTYKLKITCYVGLNDSSKPFGICKLKFRHFYVRTPSKKSFFWKFQPNEPNGSEPVLDMDEFHILLRSSSVVLTAPALWVNAKLLHSAVKWNAPSGMWRVRATWFEPYAEFRRMRRATLPILYYNLSILIHNIKQNTMLSPLTETRISINLFCKKLCKSVYRVSANYYAWCRLV